MRIFRLQLLTFLFLSFIWSGCDSILEKNKDGGKFSLGSTMRILEDRGNYNYFIQAANRGGYGKLLDGSGLITVFAPDDSAFADFLERKFGTTDVNLIPAEQLAMIVGCHIIQFAYTPEDFLAFSITSSEDGSLSGDGSCYKYKTYGREPVEVFTDPQNRRKVTIFSREKYMPVFSSRIFSNRGISDGEGDYRKLFPNVNWQGAGDHLYAGNSAITESGTPTDNGYLYIIDKVMEPSPTVYKELGSATSSDYSTSKALFDRINLYEYNQTLSKSYAKPGDSLFLFYHWQPPGRTPEIPELASEWTYHDEAGVIFDRALRYANNCFLPRNQALETYLKDFFSEFGTQASEDYLSLIPNNAIYHLLSAHLYGGRDLILPSELDMGPVLGVNGEQFRLPSSEVRDVKYCSNGIIYGMDQVFEPAVFKCLTAPLFRYPKFSFYAHAFNTKNMYQQTVDPNNRFTLFIQDDQDLITAGYSYSESTTTFGSYSFRNSGGIMSVNGVSDLILSQFMYGDIPNIADIDGIRYFVSKDDKTYFYVQNRKLYDSSDKELTIKKTFDTENGTVIQTDRIIPARSGGFAVRCQKPDVSEFKALLLKAGIVNNVGVFAFTLTDALIFFPLNEAVIKAKNEGKIPTDVAELKKYLLYYFVQMKKNKQNHFLLPGLGPDGATNQAYSRSYITLSNYITESDAKTMTFSWDPSEDSIATITDMGGYSITTIPNMIELRTNCAAYSINDCFDYRTMYGN